MGPSFRVIDGENLVTIGPVPATESLTIETGSVIKEIRVCDFSGRTMQVLQGYRRQVDVSSLEPVMYQLCVELEGEAVTQKFVKL